MGARGLASGRKHGPGRNSLLRSSATHDVGLRAYDGRHGHARGGGTNKQRGPQTAPPPPVVRRHGCDHRLGGLHHPLHARLQVPLAHGERASVRQRLWRRRQRAEDVATLPHPTRAGTNAGGGAHAGAPMHTRRRLSASLTQPCHTGRPTSTARRMRCKWSATTRRTSCVTTWSWGRSARPLRRRSARSANMRPCCWCVALPALRPSTPPPVPLGSCPG